MQVPVIFGIKENGETQPLASVINRYGAHRVGEAVSTNPYNLSQYVAFGFGYVEVREDEPSLEEGVKSE